ncbi:MAG: hypothetical protein CME65_05740 [Halobacteriovoraceae bacterium]|nr:hypothetical protein [Halobacteriovoraceae bacterium]|tara:strand:+ start:13435 stop:14019 length:585 start_codon:yes stop_codon:yes gene_type:complete
MKLNWIKHEHFIFLDRISKGDGERLLERVKGLKSKKLNLSFEATEELVGGFEYGSQFFLDRHGLEIFKEVMQPCLERYFKEINHSKANSREIESAWVNMASHSNFNPPHFHVDCRYSGVLYLRLDPNSVNPAKKDGKIYFSFDQHDPSSFKFNGIKEYQPSELEVVIFPAWQVHFVYPNQSKVEDRISIAFNIS